MLTKVTSLNKFIKFLTLCLRNNDTKVQNAVTSNFVASTQF